MELKIHSLVILQMFSIIQLIFRIDVIENISRNGIHDYLLVLHPLKENYQLI